MRRPADSGPRIVASLRDALMVEPEWRVESARGFTWWPHDFSQRISAGEPFEDEEGPGCRLVVETEVLESPKPSAALDGLLAELMRHPPMAAFRVDAAARRVSLFSAAVVRESTEEEAIPRLAVAALLQATYVSLGRGSLNHLTGLEVVTSRPPSAPLREKPDGLLRLAAERIVPAGEGPSRYAVPSDFARVAKILAARGALVRAVPSGLSARLPFVAEAPEPLAPAVSALLQIRHGEPHPELGAGVFLRLFLPAAAASSSGLPPASLALRLNDVERREGAFPAATLGSWCLEQSDPEVELPVRPGPARLCHASFLPNYVRTSGSLESVAADAVRRAAFAARIFARRGGVD